MARLGHARELVYDDAGETPALTPGSGRLNVGVMLDAPRVPAWVAWILDAIGERPHLRLAFVGLGGDSGRGRGLFALYEALDRRVFAVEPDPLAPVDVSAALAGAPRAAPDDLDVLLWLRRERPGGLLPAARHGVWAFRHGDGGGAPLFRELAAGDPVSRSVLATSGEEVIYASASATDPVSLNRTRVPVYWKSARFAIRRLEDLAAGRWEPGDGAAEPPAPDRAAPSAAETLRHVARITGRVARRKLRDVALQHQWFLGFRRRPGDRLPQEDASPWRLVLPPRDRSYADPFVVSGSHGTFVFLELLVHARGRGELAVAPLEADGTLGPIEPILPVAHHTSYPYVFASGGQTYLVPESGGAGRVDLFACTSFPAGWERVATLLDGLHAVDPTIVAHEGRYWMWVNVSVPGGRVHDETFLYFSDRLDGGWTPHPRNPVVSDVRRARPAGRPFVHRGSLVRPSQDCAGRYGRRVVFNVVEVMTPDDYYERPCGRLGPEWAGRPNLAAHTYTFDGGWEAVDGLRTFTRGAPGTATRRR